MGFVTMAIEIDGGRLAPQWLFHFWVFIDSVKVGCGLVVVDYWSLLFFFFLFFSLNFIQDKISTLA